MYLKTQSLARNRAYYKGARKVWMKQATRRERHTEIEIDMQDGPELFGRRDRLETKIFSEYMATGFVGTMHTGAYTS